MVAKAMLGTEGKNSCCVIPLLIVLFVSGCTAVSHSVTAVTKNGALSRCDLVSGCLTRFLLVLYAVASHTRLIGLGIEEADCSRSPTLRHVLLITFEHCYLCGCEVLPASER